MTGTRAESSLDLQVLHVTDPHLSSDPGERLAGVDTRASWEAVLAAAMEEGPEPDLVLVTGDIVHDGEAGSYRQVCTDLRVLGAPALLLPGNHDDNAVMAAVIADRGPVSRAGHRLLGGWLIVALDSTVPGSPGGRLEDGELDRLQRLLERHPEHPTLVSLHHQPVPVGSAWLDRIGVANGDALMTLVAGHPQVRVVLWGHVHQAFHRQRGEALLLATPSTCVQFTPNHDRFALDAQAPGWRRLTLHPDGRVSTRVGRLERLPDGLDLRVGGYR